MRWLRKALKSQKKMLRQRRLDRLKRNKNRWVYLRQQITNDNSKESEIFFVGEFDKLRYNPLVESLTIDRLLTIKLRTNKLFGIVFDPLTKKWKRLYLGVFEIKLSHKDQSRVAAELAPEHLYLHPIKCVESGRHDNQKVLFYQVGGESTGGHCFGANSGGNKYLLHMLRYGEVHEALAFMLSRLCHINDEDHTQHLKLYRCVSPEGYILPSRNDQPPQDPYENEP